MAALALPELRITARARPLAERSRETCTGAAQKRFWVKVAAQTQVWSAATSARSRRLGSARKPAWTPAALMPLAAQTPPSQGSKPNDAGSVMVAGTAMGMKVLMVSLFDL